MTHQQRRDRRREIAICVRAGDAVEDVCKRFRVEPNVVLRALREYNVPRPASLRVSAGSRRFKDVDWSQSNVNIARTLGVTPEYVRQIRRARGLPPSEGRAFAGKERRDWLAARPETVFYCNSRDLEKWSGIRAFMESWHRAAKAVGKRIVTACEPPTWDEMLAKSDRIGDCLIWKEKTSRYPKIRGKYINRQAYELQIGPIPEGKQVRNICRNLLCIEPSHLKAMFHSVK